MDENQKKTFAEQVDAVLNGADTSSSHLEVLNTTPPLLRMVGVPNLPILMTAHHVKTITQEEGTDASNYHGLGADIVKRLPELIADPVMIMDSLSHEDSIVVVTQTVDKEKHPIIGAIKLNGIGNDQGGFEISANILLSAYGKDNFTSFIERNVDAGSVLYWSKEKSQVLFETPGLQLPDNLNSLDSNTIIRKSKAFVNMQAQKNSENTQKEEENMKSDNTNASANSARERVQQIRDEMVKTLLEHIEKNPTDWQSGWNNLASGAPYNGKTITPYRGLNSLYLALLSAKKGYKDPRWVTFNQAKDLKASVKKGEKSAPVIFFEYYDKATKKAFDRRTVKDMTEEEKDKYIKENVYAVMKYTSVFNAEQCHNFPERNPDEFKMSEEERANQNEAIETIIANSTAPVLYDGGNRAYYSPGTDKIHLPVIDAFDTMQDYYATALHEIAHSTGHHTRLNRDLGGGFGSESYAKEELRAELACVFMQLEQGIQLEGKHIENHAAYLNSWLEASKKDVSVFSKAVADAQKIADYVANNYLQAVSSAELGAELEEETTKENNTEYNPMAEYLEAGRINREPGEILSLEDNIKEWYTATYPTDELGKEISPDFSFDDLNEELLRYNPNHIYKMLGVEDSVVRERVFEQLAKITNKPYQEIYDLWQGYDQSDKLAIARAQAQRLAQETGEPYVTVEWTEKSNGFPDINALDIMPLSEADKKFRLLDAQVEGEDGYYKSKLHIDYVIEGKIKSYENCRFDIGTERGGIVHHIGEFLRADISLDAEERKDAETALEYFERHMEVSAYLSDPKKLAELTEEEQGDINEYVDRSRSVLNESIPFSDYYYHMPLTPEEVKKARDAAHEAGLPFSSRPFEGADDDFDPYVFDGSMSVEDYERMWKLREQAEGEHEEESNSEAHYSIEFTLNYGNNMLLGNELKKLGFEEDNTLWEENSRIDDINIQNGNGVWLNQIRYKASNGKVVEGYYGRTFNGIVLEATNITGFTTTGLNLEEANKVTEIIKNFGVDVHINNILDTINNSSQAKGKHEEKLTLEDARNAMLDAQVKDIYHFAVRIENMPYTDPIDGYESERPEKNTYIIDNYGRVVRLGTQPIDAPTGLPLPYEHSGGREYEEVTYEELEQIATKMYAPIKAYANALKQLDIDEGKPVHSDTYCLMQAMEVIDEHYTQGGEKFIRNITPPNISQLTQNLPNADDREKYEFKALKILLESAQKGEGVGEYITFADYNYLFHTKDLALKYGGELDNGSLIITEELENSFNELLNKYDLEDDTAPNMAQITQNKEQAEGKHEEKNYSSAPIYLQSRGYALIQNEKEAYELSSEANTACKTDITSAINKHKGKELPVTVLNAIIDKYGVDRVALLCANTIMHTSYLSEHSSENKEWAAKIPQLNSVDQMANAIHVDTAQLNIFTNQVRARQITQNSAQESKANNREWLSIELPDGAVGSNYGNNTMIKMPKGEFSGYALFISTKLIKEENGKKYLRVGSDFNLRINNDGRQVELTGQELKDSFKGVNLGKTYKRVAPSRKFAKGLENLEKNVPAELRNIPVWCCYRTKPNEEKGKKDKFLISAVDGKWASSKEPERWVSFERALKYARENNCEGVSLLLNKRYGITCIDLDKCVLDASTGKLKERASKLVSELNGTYMERSTSGNGVHIFLKDDILKNGTYNSQSMVKDEDPKGDLEVFDDKHIISMTGDMISQGNELTRAGSAATVYLRQELGERRQAVNVGSNSKLPSSSTNLSDAELIRWIKSSKQGSKFDDLYSGRGVSGDKSADDAKLAYMLLYFNGGDKTQTFRIMREAGSYRPDKPDSYYLSTIDKMNENIKEYAKHPNSSSAGNKNNTGKKYGRFGGNNKDNQND